MDAETERTECLILTTTQTVAVDVSVDADVAVAVVAVVYGAELIRKPCASPRNKLTELVKRPNLPQPKVSLKSQV